MVKEKFKDNLGTTYSYHPAHQWRLTLYLGAFWYVAGSAGSNSTNRANLAAFDKWKIVYVGRITSYQKFFDKGLYSPRMLVNATNRKIEVTSLGRLPKNHYAVRLWFTDNPVWYNVPVTRRSCTHWSSRHPPCRCRTCVRASSGQAWYSLHHEQCIHSVHRTREQSKWRRTALVSAVLVRLKSCLFILQSYSSFPNVTPRPKTNEITLSLLKRAREQQFKVCSLYSLICLY